MGPQGFEYLSQMGQGYQPLAGGIAPVRSFGMEGIPFVGNPSSPAGFAAQMAMSPYFHGAMNNMGMTPMGVGHDQNVYDLMRHRQFMQTHMATMKMAAESDRASYMRTMQGGFAMAGVPFGADQYQFAQTMSGAMTTASPMLAMIAPEFTDAMGGMRGSATVMASRMVDSGRYRVDPITGQMGMSADSTQAIVRQLHQDLYSDSNISQMRGMSAGQAGSLFQQMQQRGMVSSAMSEAGYGGYSGGDNRGQIYRAMTAMSRDELGTFRQSASGMGINIDNGPSKLTPQDIDKLTLDPMVADKLKSFDADRIKRSIQSMTGAVTAMREIFGDMGQTNAPMHQLMQGLEAMTGNAVSQIDSGRLGGIVRQTYNLSQSTGVGMNGAMMLQQHAAERAAQMGIEPIFAVGAAQGGMGFGGAYRAQGHGAHTAWGAMSADQLQQMDINLRVQGAASNMANRAGTVMRLRDTFGGFEAGSEAANYAEAINSGMNQYKGANGEMRSVAVSDPEIINMLGSARGRDGQALNLSGNAIRDFMGQRDTNREFVEKYNIGAIARRAQGPDEVNPFIANQMATSITGQLRDRLVQQGMDPKEAWNKARSAASSIARGVTDDMLGMSTQEYSDRDKRNANIGRSIERQLGYNGFGDVLDGLDGDERQQFLSGTAERATGYTDRSIASSMYRGMGNLQNVFRVNNQNVLNGGDQLQLRAKIDSQVQDAMSPLGKGSLMRRAFDAIQGAEAGDPNVVMDVLTQTFGGVRNTDINNALSVPMATASAKMKHIEQLQAEINKTTDPQKQSALRKQIDSAAQELNAEMTNLSKIGEKHGLFANTSLTSERLEQTINTGRNLQRMQDDLIGLRAGIGGEVTAAQIAAVRKTPGKIDETEAVAILSARRADTLAGLKKTATADEYADAEARSRVFTDPASQTQIAALMANPTIGSDAEARALILTQRRGVAMAPTEEAVQAVMSNNPGMSREDAIDKAASGLRAQRLGRSEEELNKLGFGGISTTVTDADREALKASGVDTKGWSKEAIDKAVLGGRQRDQNTRWNAFFAGEGGHRFRTVSAEDRQHKSSIALDLLTDPGMAQRYGMRGIGISQTLTSQQKRLQELAYLYAGNDLSRLQAGALDPSKADLTTAQGRELYSRVMSEMSGIQKSMDSEVAAFQALQGKEGRQWGSNTDEAGGLLGFDPKANLDSGQRKELNVMASKVSIARQLSGDDVEAVEKYKSAKSRLEAREKAGAKPDELVDLRKDVAEAESALGAIEKRTGAKGHDALTGAIDVYKLHEQRQKAAQAAFHGDSSNLVRKLYSAYGRSTGDGPLSKDQQVLAGMMGSGSGRMLGELLLESRENLTSVAKAGKFSAGGTGIEEMSDAYFAALKSGDTSRLQKRLGLDDKGWKNFEGDILFQQQTKMLRFGGKGSSSDMNELFGEILKSGQVPNQTGGNGGGPTHMELSGTVKLTGDRLDFVSASGSTRNNVVHTG